MRRPVSTKVGTNFADKRRSLVDLNHGVIPPDTGFSFRCVLWLGGVRWRYSNLPQHRDISTLILHAIYYKYNVLYYIVCSDLIFNIK
jgi:hypothetical protein